MNTITRYEFNEKLITFELSPNNLMVNATQMAKLFGKQVNEFTSISNTEEFINEAVKNGNSRFISLKSKDDLIISRQKSGTWMHRLLALKFAAWLDPKFELWIFATIDEIIFKDYNDLKESNRRSAEIEEGIATAKEELKDHPSYSKIEGLEKQRKAEVTFRNKLNRSQTEMFKENMN